MVRSALTLSITGVLRGTIIGFLTAGITFFPKSLVHAISCSVADVLVYAVSRGVPAEGIFFPEPLVHAETSAVTGVLVYAISSSIATAGTFGKIVLYALSECVAGVLSGALLFPLSTKCILGFIGQLASNPIVFCGDVAFPWLAYVGDSLAETFDGAFVLFRREIVVVTIRASDLIFNIAAHSVWSAARHAGPHSSTVDRLPDTGALGVTNVAFGSHVPIIARRVGRGLVQTSLGAATTVICAAIVVMANNVIDVAIAVVVHPVAYIVSRGEGVAVAQPFFGANSLAFASAEIVADFA